MGNNADGKTVESDKNPSAVQSDNYIDWPGLYKDFVVTDFVIPQCNYMMGLPSISDSDMLEFKQLESTNIQTYVYQQN